MILSHPFRHERDQGEPEQQMEIRPEYTAIDVMDGLKQVMVIASVDAEEHETQDITQKLWNQWTECFRCCAVRSCKFQDHDRNENGDHSVAECFHSILAHRRIVA